MKKLYVVYGIVLCLAFGYANYTGWSFMDSMKHGQWSPHGQSKTYHK